MIICNSTDCLYNAKDTDNPDFSICIKDDGITITEEQLCEEYMEGAK